MPACQTPNRIMRTDDVPDRELYSGASYPSSSLYTLQWLAADTPHLCSYFLNNNDTAFMFHDKPKPSDLLLHYNYGAAAVKHWGRNHAVLNNRPGLPRPQAPEVVAMDPTRSVGDRTTTIAKLATARAEGIQRQAADNGGSAGSRALTATDPKQPWDEDYVMLFFWGNSSVVMERHAKKEQERNENINKWRAVMKKGWQERLLVRGDPTNEALIAKDAMWLESGCDPRSLRAHAPVPFMKRNT